MKAKTCGWIHKIVSSFKARCEPSKREPLWYGPLWFHLHQWPFRKYPTVTIKAEALNSLTITFSLTISVSGIKSENKYEGYSKNSSRKSIAFPPTLAAQFDMYQWIFRSVSSPGFLNWKLIIGIKTSNVVTSLWCRMDFRDLKGARYFHHNNRKKRSLYPDRKIYQLYPDRKIYQLG